MSADDEVTRDPRAEALFDRARNLARADAVSGRDPRILPLELREFQTEYDDEYTVAQLEQLS